MIELATVDACGNSEQITSWFTSSSMATLLCGSQSKNCWHVLAFAAYRILIPTIPTAA